MRGDFRKVLNRGGWLWFGRECYSRCFRGKRSLRSSRRCELVVGVTTHWAIITAREETDSAASSMFGGDTLDGRIAVTWLVSIQTVAPSSPETWSRVPWRFTTVPVTRYDTWSPAAGLNEGEVENEAWRKWHALLLRVNNFFKVSSSVILSFFWQQ